MGVFTKNEIVAGKGLCIILIVLHNVIHIFPEHGENEFSFSLSTVDTFAHHLLIDPITSLFSFFGWIGVSFFVFATGLGLVAKYGSKPFRKWDWLKYHYLKLFLLLFPMYSVFLILNFELTGTSLSIDNVLQQLLLLNLYHPSALSPGIYWYIGMALQLYIWFLILKRLSIKQLIIIALIVMVVTAFLPGRYLGYWRHNSLGWLPEFMAGMIYGRLPNIIRTKKVKLCLFAVGISLIGGCALTRYTFTFSGLGLCCVLISIRQRLRRVPGLFFIGKMSAALYVVHAVIRSVWFWFFPDYDLPSLSIALLVLGTSLLISYPYTLYYDKLCIILNGKRLSGESHMQASNSNINIKIRSR